MNDKTENEQTPTDAKRPIHERLVMCFYRFKEHHLWFCRHSRFYKGEYRFRDVLYWPIAWCKFMLYSRHDIIGT